MHGSSAATTVPLTTLGGLVTLASPDSLPEGASPRCYDNDYIVGQTATRDGLTCVNTFANAFAGPSPGTVAADTNIGGEPWSNPDNVLVDTGSYATVDLADLMIAGLTYKVKNPLGTTRIEWEKEGDMSPADVSMSGVTEGGNDRLTYDLAAVPLPIIHKDFRINIRALEASRKFGETIDTSQAARAARVVSEKLEAILFNGSTVNGSNTPVYGYTTALNRNVGSSHNWATATGQQMIADLLAMQAALYDDNMYGPYGVYVPKDYWNAIQGDYVANSVTTRTVLERILSIEGISSVKMSSNLVGGASGQILMVQMSPDVVDVADGLQPTTVQWDSHGGMTVNFKVMAIMVPRMKSDAAGQSGIAHYTAA